MKKRKPKGKTPPLSGKKQVPSFQPNPLYPAVTEEFIKEQAGKVLEHVRKSVIEHTHDYIDGVCRVCDRKQPVNLVAEAGWKCGDRVSTPLGNGILLSDGDSREVLVELDEPGNSDPVQEFNLEDLEEPYEEETQERQEPREERMGRGEPEVQPSKDEVSSDGEEGTEEGPDDGQELIEITPGVAKALLDTFPTWDGPSLKTDRDTVAHITGNRRPTAAEHAQNLAPVPSETPPEPEAGGISGLLAQRFREAKERGKQATVTAPSEPRVSVPDGEESPVRRLVRRTGSHLIVRARAGTGKTWTLVNGMGTVLGLQPAAEPSDQQRLIWQAMAESAGCRSIGFCAFNSSIADELKRRVPKGTDAMTMHSMGFRAVTRCFGLSGNNVVNKHKTSDLAARLLNKDLRELRKERPNLLGPLDQIVKLCKMRLVGVSDRDEFDLRATDWGREIDHIVRYYDIDVDEKDDEDTYALVPQIMQASLNPREDGCISYDDMIWLAVVTKGIRLWQYDLLCVDEAQDLNPAQQRLVRKAGRRLVMCGDDRQAIYGFTGADVDGLPTMDKVLSATDRGCELFPLTVTRRCGKAIVDEAKKIVPDFEAHDSNGPGKIGEARYPVQKTRNYWQQGSRTHRLPYDQTYLKDVESGDLVICRVNAHLVLQCTEHHKRGNRASILGRNVGEQVMALVEKVGAENIPDLISKVSDWRHKELEKEQAKRQPSDTRIINIESRADTILALCDGVGSMNDLKAKVDDLFTDDPNRPGVLHSSIHKAKGLEARHVFFLMPEGASCPHPMAKTAWAQQQEMNLKYVGITRAIESQTFVY